MVSCRLCIEGGVDFWRLTSSYDRPLGRQYPSLSQRVRLPQSSCPVASGGFSCSSGPRRRQISVGRSFPVVSIHDDRAKTLCPPPERGASGRPSGAHLVNGDQNAVLHSDAVTYLKRSIAGRGRSPAHHSESAHKTANGVVPISCLQPHWPNCQGAAAMDWLAAPGRSSAGAVLSFWFARGLRHRRHRLPEQAIVLRPPVSVLGPRP